ncbi:hypothetical protein LR48_Vigan05g082800 [Vigna angularis]|uniref:Uncharacterized protein n=1 Tax=Phaseolus angularis TaxID=3914 RepID=A0A0L9UKY5_PHAAN|nr:hypothetical protein LR48_Vigan05g082800 [Vigna angularis]
MVHNDMMDAQFKLGTPVRFKNKLWVVKDFKENGVIEIEAPYSRRVKKVDRKASKKRGEKKSRLPLNARMASSSGKRVKTMGNKRKDSERFLRTEWANEQCQFALSMDEGVDFDDVETTLCVPGGRFQRNRNDVPIHIRRSQLTPWQNTGWH